MPPHSVHTRLDDQINELIGSENQIYINGQNKSGQAKLNTADVRRREKMKPKAERDKGRVAACDKKLKNEC